MEGSYSHEVSTGHLSSKKEELCHDSWKHFINKFKFRTNYNAIVAPNSSPPKHTAIRTSGDGKSAMFWTLQCMINFNWVLHLEICNALQQKNELILSLPRRALMNYFWCKEGVTQLTFFIRSTVESVKYYYKN
jgi:hypothetical protein